MSALLQTQRCDYVVGLGAVFARLVKVKAQRLKIAAVVAVAASNTPLLSLDPPAERKQSRAGERPPALCAEDPRPGASETTGCN